MRKKSKYTVDEGKSIAKGQRRQNRLARRKAVRGLKSESGGSRVNLQDKAVRERLVLK